VVSEGVGVCDGVSIERWDLFLWGVVWI
jgi:hypothetical protein